MHAIIYNVEWSQGACKLEDYLQNDIIIPLAVCTNSGYNKCSNVLFQGACFIDSDHDIKAIFNIPLLLTYVMFSPCIMDLQVWFSSMSCCILRLSHSRIL